jgi:hypothetical protein
MKDRIKSMMTHGIAGLERVNYNQRGPVRPELHNMYIMGHYFIP